MSNSKVLHPNKHGPLTPTNSTTFVQSPYHQENRFKVDINQSRNRPYLKINPGNPLLPNDNLLGLPQSLETQLLRTASSNCAETAKNSQNKRPIFVSKTGPSTPTTNYLGLSQHLENLFEPKGAKHNIDPASKNAPHRNQEKKALTDIKITLDTSMIFNLPSGASTRRGSTAEKSFPKLLINSQAPTPRGMDFPSKSIFCVSPQTNSKRSESLNKTRNVFLDIKIANILLKFLGSGDTINFGTLFYKYRNEKQFKKLFQDRLIELSLKGLDNNDQYQYWSSIIKFRKLKNDHPFAFTRQFVRKCKYMQDICCDLDRTFPEDGRYLTEEGRSSLLRVLAAIANTVHEVGYIQGLNFIAGVALAYLKEEDAFWVLMYMLEKLNIKEILHESFLRVNILNFQLEAYLNHFLPEVVENLQTNGIAWTHFTATWFITLFSNYLAFPVTLKLWNLLFIKGIKFLIQFSLAIFSRCKDSILYTEVDNLGALTRETLQQISEDDDSIFKEALSFKVTNRLMGELETYYFQGKPKLKLSYDSSSKLHWRKITLQRKIEKATPSSLNNISPLHEDKERQSISSVKTRDSITRSYEKKSPFLQNILKALKAELPETLKDIFKSNNAREREITKRRHTIGADVKPKHNSNNQRTTGKIAQAAPYPNHTKKGSLTFQRDRINVGLKIVPQKENLETLASPGYPKITEGEASIGEEIPITGEIPTLTRLPYDPVRESIHLTTDTDMTLKPSRSTGSVQNEKKRSNIFSTNNRAPILPFPSRLKSFY